MQRSEVVISLSNQSPASTHPSLPAVATLAPEFWLTSDCSFEGRERERERGRETLSRLRDRLGSACNDLKKSESVLQAEGKSMFCNDSANSFALLATLKMLFLCVNCEGKKGGKPLQQEPTREEEENVAALMQTNINSRRRTGEEARVSTAVEDRASHPTVAGGRTRRRCLAPRHVQHARTTCHGNHRCSVCLGAGRGDAT